MEALQIIFASVVVSAVVTHHLNQVADLKSRRIKAYADFNEKLLFTPTKLSALWVKNREEGITKQGEMIQAFTQVQILGDDKVVKAATSVREMYEHLLHLNINKRSGEEKISVKMIILETRKFHLIDGAMVSEMRRDIQERWWHFRERRRFRKAMEKIKQQSDE